MYIVRRKAESEAAFTIYIICIATIQSLSSSVQKHMNALPNRNATNQITGSSVGATRRTQPPANALTSAPNTHRIFTITDYLQPLQTPS